MKNFFYSNAIANKISSLIDNNLPQSAANNIAIGDLSILPAPDKLAGYLPAIIINAREIENVPANESVNIIYTPYYFTVYCVYSYDFEGAENSVTEGKLLGEAAANILMNYRTLDDFSIPKSTEEAGGLVVYSAVANITFDSAETEIFRMLEIPVFIVSIDFCVGFRTYRQ